MLKNIDKHYSIIHIAGREYALLCLEILYKPLDEILKTDFRSWGIDDVIQLVHAAMCSVSKNFKAVNRRDFEYVRPTVAELGELINTSDLPLLRREIIDAVLDSKKSLSKLLMKDISGHYMLMLWADLKENTGAVPTRK